MSDLPEILLIDEDCRLVRCLMRVLKERGYSVITVPSRDRAVLLLQARRSDLLIMDLNKPEPDGFELLKAEQSEFPCLTNLVISGYLDRAFLKAAKIVAVMATLDKPVTADVLTAEFQGLRGT